MKNNITTKVFILAIFILHSSCGKPNGNELYVAFFIYTTESKYSNYYIEVLCDRSVKVAKGLETELVSQIMYKGEETKPGIELYISDEVFYPDTIYDENNHPIEWNTYLGPERKEWLLNVDQYKSLKKCVSEIIKLEEGNKFPQIYDEGEWKSNNAGIIMMYKDKIYSFWLDSVDEPGNITKKCLDYICPIQIEIPKQDNPYN